MFVLVFVVMPVLVFAIMAVFVLDEQSPHHLIVLMIEDVTVPDVARTAGIPKPIVFDIQACAWIKSKQVAAGSGYTG